MTTKERFRNKFTIQLRERDHGPAHVHLAGAGHDVTIDLLTMKSDGEWPQGLKVEVMAWIATHRDELMEEWKKWHE
ncbi:MAG: DUF4160 domain-containing protein [Desulfobacteraceae bacterium]|nr:DUF4160 domain-containing protein [Desulfobacteraceae bacterium]